MTTKEFESLERRLLPNFPGFAIHRRLMLISPPTDILRGVCFDPSGFDKQSFYITAFVLPLFVPTKHLHFNFGKRVRHVGGIDGWNANEPNLIAELTAALQLHAMAFLSSAASPLEFVELAKTFSSGNPHTPEAIAFSLARAGETDQATQVIDQLLNRLDLTVSWQLDIANNAKALRTKLATDPAEAQRQLEVWKLASLRNLGLEEYRRTAE
jgi:hypothetical protein